MGADFEAEERTAHLNDLIRDLRHLRASASVSYRQIAARITLQREQAGASSAAARIAPSTVSDMFRLGRARINADLFAEIACVLEGDSGAAARWRERAVEAMAPARDSADAAPIPGGPVPARPPGAGPSSFVLTKTTPPRFAWMVVLVLCGVLLNATGKFFNPLLGDVLFLDMIGTAVVALLAGPWAAAAVGILFAGVELLKNDLGGALFALTMVSAGLIWGYGVRHGAARSLPRFLGLSAVVAVATSALAVPISVLYYGGQTGRGLEGLYSAFEDGQGVGLWVAVTGVNLGVSLLDKVLSGAIAYGVVRLMRPAIATTTPGSELPRMRLNA